MKPLELPPQKYLKECFDYEDGNLIWKERPRSHFASNNGYGTFNTRFAGTVAGHIATHKNGKTYSRINLGNSLYRTHRLIWAWFYGSESLSDLEVDHIDGDGTNNKIENLRAVTSLENKRNAKRRSDNKTGISGVDNYRNSWRSRIKYKGKYVDTRQTQDFFEACCRRKSLELKYNFHPNHGTDRAL